MPILRSFAFTAVSMVLLTVSCGATGKDGTTPDPGVAVARVAAVAEAAKLNGEVAVIDGKDASASRRIGTLEFVEGARDRDPPRWLWASVTKQVTAVLVMQQVQAGRLSLDGTIETYLPTFAGESGGEITIRQLLLHRSGLPNPNDAKADADGESSFYRETGDAISNASRAAGYCAQTPKAKPGETFEYNNCDYLVLGAILEQISGQSFAKLIATRIDPQLGGEALHVARDSEARGGATVIGHASRDKPYPAVNIATYGAAAALVGTRAALERFDRALMRDKLLDASSFETLTRGDPQLSYQALGVWSYPATLKGCAKPVDVIERRGDVAGTQVRNVIAPKIDRALVVLIDDASVDFGEVWQGSGLAYELMSAAFCSDNR